MPKILHSGTWWQDYHRRRQNHAANRAPIDFDSVAPAGDQGQVYTFLPQQAKPVVGTFQNNGRLHYSSPDVPPENAATSSSAASSGSRSKTRKERPRPASVQRAEARLLARASADETLIARLGESAEERRRREMKEQLRGTVKPLTKEERRRKQALVMSMKEERRRKEALKSRLGEVCVSLYCTSLDSSLPQI
ncbi:hypothetical protein DFH06DRAFT_1336142 [Mycena polygramma]|nr:hypothetical protein DFH06DRAFT_1336142 [Mycena polygramma]